MEDAIKNKIIGLKAEVYEMIKQQELLALQNNQIQETKFRKVQEIQKLEEQYADNPVKDML
jgi:hypothetical protein